MRIGMGYDVHRLVENRELILGGVTIDYELGLLGHSDADVLLHAIMDALLGAAALGDIGKHFPDNDEKYRGADSLWLLECVRGKVKEAGYVVGNVDATIIAQKPKMRPYIESMRENVAKALCVDVSRINIKATTEEGLGFTGSGQGHVGAHVANSLLMQGIADELVLVDQNQQKLASEVQDLRDAAAYLPHRVTVRAGDFADLGECDVIVNSVGKIELLRGTHDRVTEMDFTIPAVRGYAERVKASGFDGVLINITNPCDIVTRELALGLGLPKGRVFGTGTGLDTSRLLSALARQTGVDHKSITCYMLGEHGNDQFAPWSCVSFRGKPLADWAKTDEKFRFDGDALQKEAIGGGWVTFAGKFCTEYGIATTAARMVSIVLHDEKAIMPASMELCGEYGESGLFAGVPCVIGANGVEQVVELPPTPEEKATFHQCCEGIRRNMEHLKEI